MDDRLGIDWRIPREEMILSAKDLAREKIAPDFSDFEYLND